MKESKAHPAWCIGHGTDDLGRWKYQILELGDGNSTENTDEQLSIQSFLHPILPKDSMGLVRLAADCMLHRPPEKKM